MKVWHKIMVAPALAIFFTMLLGALSYGVLTQQNSALEEVFKTRFGGYQVAAESAQEISEVHSNIYRLFTWLSSVKDESVKQVKAEQQARIDSIALRVTQFAARANLQAGERKVAEGLLRDLANYRKSVEKAIDLSAVDVAIGIGEMATADTLFQEMLKEFKGLVQIEKRLAQESYDSAGATFAKALLILLAILALAIAISSAVSLYMARAIVRPLKVAIVSAGHIARGDLSADIDTRGSDETAELLRALQGMTLSLRTLVGEVASGAHTVSDTSAQIAQGNLDLSQRTEEQASTLEETASSLEELTATVTQNAQNARQASLLAVGASDVALKGGAVVGEVVSTMTGISEASRKIIDIISVIDGIAFQTNILALNAAVEAARAGEQGRGFAVVASEVRSLAQRSAAAAKEIKTLIGNSVDKVEAGTKLVDAAGKTMEEIVGSVRKVSDLIAEIAAASQEQSSGIAQVNTAVTQMDQVVQQNASLVEEATAATESMREQAGSLLQTVARFKLNDAQQADAPLRPASAAAMPRIRPEPSAAIRIREQRPALASNLPAFGPIDHQPLQASGEWKEF